MSLGTPAALAATLLELQRRADAYELEATNERTSLIGRYAARAGQHAVRREITVCREALAALAFDTGFVGNPLR